MKTRLEAQQRDTHPSPQSKGKVSSELLEKNGWVGRKANLSSQGPPTHPSRGLFSKSLGGNRLTLNSKAVSGQIFLEFSHGKPHPATIWYLSAQSCHASHAPCNPCGSLARTHLLRNAALTFSSHKEELSTNTAGSATFLTMAGGSGGKLQKRGKLLLLYLGCS